MPATVTRAKGPDGPVAPAHQRPAPSPLFDPPDAHAAVQGAAAASSPTLSVLTLELNGEIGVSFEVTSAGGMIGSRRGHSDFDFHFPAAEGCELELRHDNWAATRALILGSMQRCQIKPARIDRYCNCGAGCTVHWHPELGQLKTRAYYCHDRHCQPCGKARAQLIANNLEAHLKTGRYLHVTLTLKSTSEPLAKEIKRLYTAFRKLRGRKQWKKWTDGGAAFFEVTWNSDTGEFHPHLHVLLNGAFIPHAALSSLWLKITGDSNHVFIRQVTSARDACQEVAKYASKPIHGSILQNQNALDEMMLATKSLRLCTTFGTWRGWQLTKQPEVIEAHGWILLGRLPDIVRAARQGNAKALRILEMLLCPTRTTPTSRPPPPLTSS